MEAERGRTGVVVVAVDEMDGVERPDPNVWGIALRRGISDC